MKESFLDRYQQLANLLPNLTESLLNEFGCRYSKTDLESSLNKTLSLAYSVLARISEPNRDKWPLQLFLVCTICCFIASSAMHLFWVRSVHVCNLTHNIDLSGISLMIFGSAYGLIYYIFKCNAASYYIYLGIQVFSAMGILLCINCKMFTKEKYQGVKVVLFIVQAFVALFAVIHWRWLK